MAAILGLRDSQALLSDRFQNWRRQILYSFPNGSAILTAFLSTMKPEDTNDAVFNWYEKPLATQRTTLSASYTNVATTVSVTDITFRANHLIMNESTGEIMQITSVDTTGLVLTVKRGAWGTAVASAGADDAIICVGNAVAEGASTPQILQIDPTPLFNYTQIFRTALGMTGTAKKTSLKYAKEGRYVEAAREALNYHSIEMEKSFIFGVKALYTDSVTGNTLRTTDGVLTSVDDANVDTPAGGILTEDLWDDYSERMMRVCVDKSNTKLCIGGSGSMSVLNRLAKKVGRIELMPGDKTYGFRIQEWIQPSGTLYLYSHPLFTQHPVWRNYLIVVDIKALNYRYLTGRDTQRLTNRQNPGTDSQIDEFLTECGLELHFGTSHFWLTNVAKASL